MQKVVLLIIMIGIALAQEPKKSWTSPDTSFPTGPSFPFGQLSTVQTIQYVSFIIPGKDGKEALRITSKGEVIVGEGLSIDQSAKEFVAALKKYYNFPSGSPCASPNSGDVKGDVTVTNGK